MHLHACAWPGVNRSPHFQVSSFHFTRCRHPMRVHDRRNSSLGVFAFQTSKEREGLVFLDISESPLLFPRYTSPAADTCSLGLSRATDLRSPVPGFVGRGEGRNEGRADFGSARSGSGDKWVLVSESCVPQSGQSPLRSAFHECMRCSCSGNG